MAYGCGIRGIEFIYLSDWDKIYEIKYQIIKKNKSLKDDAAWDYRAERLSNINLLDDL